MNKKKRIITLWEHYLSKEIGIEFKACLYFFCVLFFYSIYKVLGGEYEANIIHMAEMILLTYVMGYIQVYLLSDFDEAEHLKLKESFYILLCSSVYAGISFLCGWFDGSIAVTIGFAVYMIITYLCAFMVYKSKRKIDEKLLNEDLKAFQERNRNE